MIYILILTIFIIIFFIISLLNFYKKNNSILKKIDRFKLFKQVKIMLFCKKPSYSYLNIIRQLQLNNPSDNASFQDFEVIRKAGIFNNKPIFKVSEFNRTDLKIFEKVYLAREFTLIVSVKSNTEYFFYENLLQKSCLEFHIINCEIASFEIISAINKVNVNYAQVSENIKFGDITNNFERSVIKEGYLVNYFSENGENFKVYETFYDGKIILVKREECQNNLIFKFSIKIKEEKLNYYKVNKSCNCYQITNIVKDESFYIQTNAFAIVSYDNLNVCVNITVKVKNKTQIIFISTKKKEINYEYSDVLFFIKNVYKWKNLFNIKLLTNDDLFCHKIGCLYPKVALLYFLNYNFLFDKREYEDVKSLFFNENIDKFNFIKVYNKIHCDPFIYLRLFLSYYLGVKEFEESFLFSKPEFKENFNLEFNSLNKKKTIHIYQNEKIKKMIADNISFYNLNQIRKKDLYNIKGDIIINF